MPRNHAESMAGAIRNFALDEPVLSPIVDEMLATLKRQLGTINELSQRVGPPRSPSAANSAQYRTLVATAFAQCIKALYDATYGCAMDKMTFNEHATELVVAPRVAPAKD